MLFNTLIEILWLSYRFGLTFKFFFKYFLLFKFCSIYYDYYLDFYPKIFNDQGFWILFFRLRSYLLNEVYFYYVGVLFILFLLFMYLFFFWPTFVETRFVREHLNKGLKGNKIISKSSNKKEMKLKEIEFNLEKKFGINSKGFNDNLLGVKKKLIILNKFFKSSKKN